MRADAPQAKPPGAEDVRPQGTASTGSSSLVEMSSLRGWQVLSTDDPMPLATVDTREDAISLAAHLQRVLPGIRRMIIYEPDGTVRQRTTLGHHDPLPGRRRS